MREHKRIIFNGDNYSAEWQDEARKRGLPVITTTPEALEVLKSPDNIALFEKHGVLSPDELASRYEVFRHEYNQVTQIEAECAVTMARTMILPAALRYQGDLATTIKRTQAVSDAKLTNTQALLKQLSGLCEQGLEQSDALDAAAAGGDAAAMIAAQAALRATVDGLEAIVPDDLRPLPSYAEMMFML